MILFDYFTDPILRGPTLGTMLMCFATALVGVLVFVKKRSLVGETLSHASYPGVILAIALGALFSLQEEGAWLVMIFAGAATSAFFALFLINFLERRLRWSADLALSFILSGFFGLGVALVSLVQRFYPSHYQQLQFFLFGQAATMTDFHILIYAVLAALIALTLILCYKPLQMIAFDPIFAATKGVSLPFFSALFSFLLVLAIVVGMRSAGLILVSAMLIAPAATARQWSSSLNKIFWIAAIVGVLSGWLGNILSFELSLALHLSLPTGPMIVLTAAAFAFGSLLLAPHRGVLMRYLRTLAFQRRCIQENILKTLWKAQEPLSLHQLRALYPLSGWRLRAMLGSLVRKGFVERVPHQLVLLTSRGEKKARQIVRLHRLWEAYLVQNLGLQKERVHLSAEEMEHVLTPELELELSRVLGDPERDPHQQPIPPRGGE